MKAGNKISPNLFNPSSQNDKLTNDDMLRLLDYYRMKVDMIEKERFDWLTKLEEVSMKSEEFHEKEWELRKLTEQITELQQSLSEANIALNQERKKCVLKSYEEITSSEFKNQILTNITSLVNSSSLINGSDFIAVIFPSNEMDPKEQIKKEKADYKKFFSISKYLYNQN